MGASAMNTLAQSVLVVQGFKKTYISPRGVSWRAESVVREIQVPTQQLHDNHSAEGDDRSLRINVMISSLSLQIGCRPRYLFEYLHVIFGLHYLLGRHSEFRAGLRDVVLITLHGTGSLVVDVMGVAPRVVRRQDEGVCDIADSVVDPLVV
jgi:hypothetical protein